MAKEMISILESTNLVSAHYIVSDHIDVQEHSQLDLHVIFIKGATDGFRLKIERSDDGLMWFCVSAFDDARGVVFEREINHSSSTHISTPVSLASACRVMACAIGDGRAAISIAFTKP